MAVTEDAPPPGPSTLAAIRGLRRDGFLHHLGVLWRRYGDTFEIRLGPRRIVVAIHPDAVREVTVTDRAGFDKLSSYDPVRSYLTGDGLVASTGTLWRRQRKLMAPLFTPRGIRAHVDTMLADGVSFSDRWRRLADEAATVDVGVEMMELTASIILRAMFSTKTFSTGTFSTGTGSHIADMKSDVETMIGFVNGRMAGLRAPPWLPTARNRGYRAARQRVHAFISEIIERRARMPADERPPDLLTRLMEARDDDGSAMSASLLRDESVTVFFAGHETTARTLSATWYALATAPEVEARLHAELDAVLGGALPTVEDLRRLPYTLQVVKEVLRLYPAAPVYARDATRNGRLQGHPIDAGTPVMLAPYYTHRHPGFWSEPERFDPDRWGPEQEAGRHPQAYHPFAAGERICIGNHFSLLESHLLLAILASRFSLRPPPDFAPQWAMNGVLTTTNGMPMLIRRRDRQRA